MTADNTVQIALLLLKASYKAALAHHGGQEGEAVAGLKAAIAQTESTLELARDYLRSTNVHLD